MTKTIYICNLCRQEKEKGDLLVLRMGDDLNDRTLTEHWSDQDNDEMHICQMCADTAAYYMTTGHFHDLPF